MSPPHARAAVTLAVVLAAVACGQADLGVSTTPPGRDPAAAPPFAHRGITHVSWWHDEYAYPQGEASRSALADSGANWATVLVTGYMESPRASAIARLADRTPDDDAVVAAIRHLQSLGLRVMLKPHVDVLDGTWRGAIRPSDPGRWFASYGAFIAHYAALAEANGAAMFCVGTELATLSDARHLAEWSALIAEVRALYRGPLTYAANAVTAADEYTSVAFWDQLDVAGLDPYTPLTDDDAPTVDELARAWSHNRLGEDMVAAFRNWQASHGRPVLFTELGYRSADGANRAPWNATARGTWDPGEQADCYEAAFRVWAREPWLIGISWWAWPVPPPGPVDTGYAPQGKPAEGVLRAWQRD